MARLDIVAHREVVEVYLESRLDMCGKSLASILKGEPSLREEIIKKLLEQSNGMFLLAHLQVEHVCHQRKKSDVRKALASLAKDVNEFYSDSFKRLEQMEPEHRDIALKSLAYVFLARKQLSLKELCHALATQRGDRDLDRDALEGKESLQGILHGLIRIDDGSNLVGLAHLTLHEFMQNHQDKLPPECEKTLSVTCLTYLSFDTFATGVCKTDEDLSKRLEEYCFLEYASQYWASHAVNYMDELINEALLFLNDEEKLATSVQMLYLPRRQKDKRHNHCPRHFTSLHAAAYWGLAKVLSDLEYTDEDIDCKDSNGMTAILLSAQFGHTFVVKQLLDMKAELNNQSNRGETALSLAAKQGHTTTVGLLLQQGANRIIEDDEGWTALHWAIVGGHTGAVKLLLAEVGSDIESDKSGHDKALILAAEKGNDAMVRMLLAEGANVNYKDDQGSTPLDWSVPMEHEATTRILLDRGADPNSTDHYGNTSLHWSIANRVIAHMLVTHGAEIDKKNDQGQSAFVWSTLADQVDVVETLTGLGANVNTRDSFGCTALHAAALQGNETIVQILLQHKADPNFRDKDEWTPLHAAVVHSHHHVSGILAGLTVNGNGIVSQVTDWIANEDMTTLVAEMADRKSAGSSVVIGLRSAVNSGYHMRLLALLEQGDDINAMDKIGGSTALTHAAWMGQEDTVQLLLDHGAAVDARDRSGRSALHWASEGGYPDMVTILVDRGANVDMKLFGWTPLLLGARRWNSCVVERLIGSGANLSARDFHGRSVLHWSCKHGDKYMTELVLRAGAVVDAYDHYDQTAIHYATASSQPTIVRLLLKYGANPSQQARDGSTVLHMAAYTGQLDIAAVLFNDKGRKQRREAGMATGIVPTAVDKDGFTAQAIAELTNNLQFVRLLRREKTESPGEGTCDIASVDHLPIDQNGLHEGLLAKPSLRLPHDDECDYTINGGGMNSLGIPIFSKEVRMWLHKQSELQQNELVKSSVMAKLENLSLEPPRGR